MLIKGFNRVVQGGFYWSLILSLNIKKENLVNFTWLGLLFLVRLAISNNYPTYHQENVEKDTFPSSEQNYASLCMKTVGTLQFISRLL